LLTYLDIIKWRNSIMNFTLFCAINCFQLKQLPISVFITPNKINVCLYECEISRLTLWTKFCHVFYLSTNKYALIIQSTIIWMNATLSLIHIIVRTYGFSPNDNFGIFGAYILIIQSIFRSRHYNTSEPKVAAESLLYFVRRNKKRFQTNQIDYILDEIGFWNREILSQELRQVLICLQYQFKLKSENIHIKARVVT